MTNSLVTLEMILEELRKKIKSRERTDGDEIKKERIFIKNGS